MRRNESEPDLVEVQDERENCNDWFRRGCVEPNYERTARILNHPAIQCLLPRKRAKLKAGEVTDGN